MRQVELMHGLSRKLKGYCRRFADNVAGVAALEFAMIVPLMVMMLIGALEFGTALTIDRRTSMVASSVADLVSRTDKVTDDQLHFMTDKISKSMMRPYKFQPIKIHIMSIKANITNPGDVTVNWARSYSAGDTNMTSTAPEYNAGDPYPVPAGLMSAGSSLIVTKVTYDHTPLVFTEAQAQTATGRNSAATGAFQMKDTFYLSPRTKACVSLNNTNCVTGQPF